MTALAKRSLLRRATRRIILAAYAVQAVVLLVRTALLFPFAIVRAMKRPDRDVLVATYHGAEFWLCFSSKTRSMMIGTRMEPGDRIVWESQP